MPTNIRRDEPVRLGGWLALALGLALQAIILWSVDVPPKAIAGALATLATVQVPGLEWARNRVTPTRPGR